MKWYDWYTIKIIFYKKKNKSLVNSGPNEHDVALITN